MLTFYKSGVKVVFILHCKNTKERIEFKMDVEQWKLSNNPCCCVDENK